MVVNLAAGAAGRNPRSFPYANWGPLTALLGVLLALGVGIVLGAPALVLGANKNGELSTWANVAVQIATEVGFLSVSMLIALRAGATSLREVLSRLGVRRFSRSALLWMAAAIGIYILFASLYAIAFGKPHQKDIANNFGTVPIKIALLVILAPISEEVCFRGMLFGGLRERLPRISAALLSGLIFGALHAVSGVSAVPPLIIFGLLLALLYERTGSIVPGIILHMLNNSVALLGQ